MTPRAPARSSRPHSALCVVALAALAHCAPSSRRDTGVDDSAVADDAPSADGLSPSDSSADAAVEAAPAPDAPASDTVAPADSSIDAPAPVMDAALPDAPREASAPDAPPDTSSGPPCSGGLRRCNGVCVDIAVDRTNCGACNTACTMTARSTTTCNAGECERVCDTGYADCDGMLATGCETDLSTPEHCGSCTRACSAGQVCAGGTCMAAAMAPPPRQFAPLSGSRVSRHRPEFSWQPVAGAGGTQVQVCRQRSCADVVATVESSTNRGAVTADLMPGVYFWRARSGTAGRYGTTWSPVWQFRVPVRNSTASGTWGAEPDFNGDGFADVAVGAPDRAMNTGAAYVFYGSAIGPSMTPDWSQTGPDGVNADYGQCVSSIGDVNGDGFVDLGVGTPDGGFAAGRVYIYLGGPSGLERTPSFTISGPEGLSRLGQSFSAIGDANNDGYADIAVGAPILGGYAQGAVYLYEGRPRVAYTSAAQVFRAPAELQQHNLGYALSAAGDVNGDGFNDLMVSGPGSTMVGSAAYLYNGGPTGYGGAASITLRGMGTPPRNGEFFGISVAGAGDVNGDGFHDVVVGAASGNSNPNGFARVYLGSAPGLIASPAWELVGSSGEVLGYSVSGGADLNGDGFDDIAVVSSSTGRVRVYYGSAVGIAGEGVDLITSEPGRSASATRVALLGDVDNDGFSDVVVGSPGYDLNRGRVAWYRGGREGVATTAAWSVVGPDANARFGDWVGRW